MTDRTYPGRRVRERVSYRDADGTTVSTLILETVASLTDAEPGELPPLYDFVEPEALDALVAHHTRSAANRFRLEFTFGGVDVVVSGDGEFVVLEPAA